MRVITRLSSRYCCPYCCLPIEKVPAAVYPLDKIWFPKFCPNIFWADLRNQKISVHLTFLAQAAQILLILLCNRGKGWAEVEGEWVVSYNGANIFTREIHHIPLSCEAVCKSMRVEAVPENGSYSPVSRGGNALPHSLLLKVCINPYTQWILDEGGRLKGIWG